MILRHCFYVGLLFALAPVQAAPPAKAKPAASEAAAQKPAEAKSTESKEASPAKEAEPDAQLDAKFEEELSETGGSPADVLTVLERHLKAHPDCKKKPEIIRVLARIAVEQRDRPREIEYGPMAIDGGSDDPRLLEHVSRALLDKEDPESLGKALRYATRLTEKLRDERKSLLESKAYEPGQGKHLDDMDYSLRGAWIYVARAQGMLGHNEDSLKAADEAWRAYPSLDAALERARVLERLGRFAEALDAAADAFVVEDEHSESKDRQRARERLAELAPKANVSDPSTRVLPACRAKGYALPYVPVDGNDVVATAVCMQDMVVAARAGGGPVLVEASTYRWHGHYEGDPQRYRTEEELAEWQERDPLVVHRARLIAAGVDASEIDALESSVDTRLDEAVERARRLSAPAVTTLFDFVAWARPATPEPPALPADAPVFRTMDAIRNALEAELESDERVFLAGIDIGEGGNVFGLTRGLRERFGDRVRDTPISETAIVGLGVGAAMAGMRPIVEVMYLDFLGVCLDQLLNQAAKLPFMTGGSAEMALTVRTQFGAGRSSGSQHSQSLEALLAHIPGLSVVMPSTPADTYGLLRAAIADPNPVVFVENRLLYGMKGPEPAPDFLLPIGRSAVVRAGSDITVVSVSRMVHEALAAAEELRGEGISVEVIDLRTVAPLDLEPVLASVHKTSRLLIAHEAVVPFGIGAEIAATVAREGFWDLDAPIQRVGAAATPPPYAPELERAWLPDRHDIAEAIRTLAAV